MKSCDDGTEDKLIKALHLEHAKFQRKVSLMPPEEAANQYNNYAWVLSEQISRRPLIIEYLPRLTVAMVKQHASAIDEARRLYSSVRPSFEKVHGE